MAIKVKTGLVQQQKADASVFGYQQTYASPLNEVSRAFKEVARATSSIGGGMARERMREQQEQAQAEADRQRELDAAARKQAAVDKSVANTAASTYGMGLESSIAAVEDAYAIEDEEAIAKAEAELSAFDPTAANFTLDNYTSTNVSDSTYYTMNGYMDAAMEKFHAATLKLRKLRPHYQLRNILNTAQSNASNTLHTTLQRHLNQTMKPDAFDTALMSIVALGNHEGLGALTAEDAVIAYMGEASGMVAQLFIHNIQNSSYVEDVEYYSSKGVDQYGDLLEFVNESDRQSIIDAAEKKVDDLTADGAAQQRANAAAVSDQASNTFLNTLSQPDAANIQGMVAASANTLETFLGVQQGFLGGADLDKFLSVKAIANFFTLQRIQNNNGEDVVTSPFRQGLLTALELAKQNGELPKYFLDEKLLSSVRPDDAGKLRNYVATIASKIHKGLQDGDTAVLNLLTPDVTEQANLLKKLGYLDIPLFTASKVEYNVNDPKIAALHIKDTLSLNTPSAVAQRGYIMANSNTKAERLQGLTYMYAAVAGSPQEASDITMAMAGLSVASERYDESIHTPIVQMFLQGDAAQMGETTEMTSSEIFNKYKVALQNGDTQLANAYLSLFQGLIVDTRDAHVDDLMGVKEASFFSTDLDEVSRAFKEGSMNFVAGKSLVLRNKIMKTFFDKERELLTQRLGLSRVADNDVKVTMLPSMIHAIDLEFRKPMNPILENLFSAKVPFTDFPLLLGIGPDQAEAISRFFYYDREHIAGVLGDGDYTVLPDLATNRTAEIYAIEVAHNANLDFTPEMVKNIDKFPAGFREMVEEFDLTTKRTKEELADLLQEATVRVGGAVYPFLDYSTHSFHNNEIGVSVRYYDRSIGDYETLVDIDSNPVIITNTAAANRLEAEGGWYPFLGMTLQERVDKLYE